MFSGNVFGPINPSMVGTGVGGGVRMICVAAGMAVGDGAGVETAVCGTVCVSVGVCVAVGWFVGDGLDVWGAGGDWQFVRKTAVNKKMNISIINILEFIRKKQKRQPIAVFSHKQLLLKLSNPSLPIFFYS